jgi:hypothetical protein
MIGTVGAIHCRIQKAIGPPLRAGPTVKFQCFIAGTTTGAARCSYI